MFRDAKVGNKVWSLLTRSWGTIIDIVEIDKYPVKVHTANIGTETFTWDGFYNINHKTPTLLWGEIPMIVLPEKPIDLEIGTKLIVWNNDSNQKYKRYFSHFDEDGVLYVFDKGISAWAASDDTVTIRWDNWEVYKEDLDEKI